MRAFNSSLYECRVFHRRYVRAATRFRYNLFMILLDLDELPELDRRLSWFGWNRWRPLSFYDRDHFRWLSADEAGRSAKASASLPESAGDMRGENDIAGASPTRDRVRKYLREHGEEYEPGRILLLTNLRVLGYVFNPVSFFYCYDREGRLRNVLSEVNNTYLEQKPFLISVDSERDWTEERTLKNFYVSPFIAHNTDFYFRLREPGDLLSVRIDSLRGPHRILKAVLHGQRRALTNGALFRMFFSYPLVSVKIIVAIHWQALKLFLNKIYVHDKDETDKKIQRLKKEREATYAR
ncbi:MAG: DUF1365 domain-containing protein [bacterium]|nr:DUF1365 domain-containing protein [bacterium]